MEKRHRSKLWLVLATLVLITSVLLSACTSNGNNNQPSGTSGTTTENTQTQQPESGTAQQPEESPVITILTSNQNIGYVNAISNPDEDPYVQRIKELSGYDVKYEFLSTSPDYETQLTVRFASGDLPDLIWTTGIEDPAHAGAVDQGAFLELNDLIDQYGPNLKANIPQDVWDNVKVSKQGKIYGIPLLAPFSDYWIAYHREDWLAQAGMTELKTVDDYLKFYEYIKVNDMNGDGDPNDEYGFYARENMASSEMFFGAFGVTPGGWVLKDGQLEPSMIQPEMKEAIAFWKMLYEQGYVNPNMFTNQGLDWDAGIRQGKAGTWIHTVNNYYSWTIDYVEENAKIGMLPSPVGQDGKQGLYSAGTRLWRVWVVPSQTEHPENVIKFLDWAWADERAQELFTFGIEGRNFTRDNGKIVWEETNPRNQENDEKGAYQYVMNPTGLAAGNAMSLEAQPGDLGSILLKGYEDAKTSGIVHPGLGMPALQAFSTRPELVPGFAAGRLFLDMFAKVITGSEPLDPAFDNFVAEWKRRGGDEGIREATEWYNNK